MNDRNGRLIECGDKVKYSFYEYGIPVFIGSIISKDGVLYIEHSNKVSIKLDDTIKFIEIAFKASAEAGEAFYGSK